MNNLASDFLTSIEGFSSLKILDPESAQKLALLEQLINYEKCDSKTIQKIQDQQLVNLVKHFLSSNNTYVKKHFDKKNVDINHIRDLFSKLPILSRNNLQEFFNRPVIAPPTQGQIISASTSGSTGKPVTVFNTSAAMYIRQATALQGYSWQNFSCENRIAIITAHSGTKVSPEKLTLFNHWGPPFYPLLRSGERAEINILCPINRQIQHLSSFNPEILLTYPSNLKQLLLESQTTKVILSNLKHVLLIGETVSEDLITTLREVWNVNSSCNYSSEELGIMAMQCPQIPNHLHISSPTHIIEILREDGTPVGCNEQGRIIVTDLFNFAMPILRYEIGDIGEFKNNCTCGRNLPVISSIYGRYRNMLRLSDGRKFWPRFGLRKIYENYGIKQFQVIQTKIDNLEVHFHVDKILTEFALNEIQNTMIKSLGISLDIHFFEHFEPLDKKTNGKFEEFISLIANDY